jgi:hypothetical protein
MKDTDSSSLPDAPGQALPTVELRITMPQCLAHDLEKLAWMRGITVHEVVLDALMLLT